MNKKGQVQYLPTIVIILLVLYFLNQSLNPKVVEINIDPNVCGNLNLNIEKGTTVKWINKGQQQAIIDFSTITNPPTKVTMPQGASYSLKFDNPGVYSYRCIDKQAQVIVQ